jgi:hypothetical protein
MSKEKSTKLLDIKKMSDLENVDQDDLTRLKNSFSKLLDKDPPMSNEMSKKVLKIKKILERARFLNVDQDDMTLLKNSFEKILEKRDTPLEDVLAILTEYINLSKNAAYSDMIRHLQFELEDGIIPLIEFKDLAMFFVDQQYPVDIFF